MKVKYGDQVLEIPYSHASIENILNYFNLDQSKQELDLLSIDNGFISLLDAFHLTDIGYDSEDTIEIIDCQPKNFYFKIKNNNYLYKRSIYKSTTIFEVKKYFSKAFFTVSQNIIIDFNGKKLQDDELLFEFNVTENSHFTVETINNYDLYYTFFGQFHFICLPQNSTFYQLKNTILAYSQKSVSIISNSFSYDEKLIRNCKQEGITNIDMIDQTKISEMIENVPLFEFSETQTDKKCQNFPISIEFSGSQSKIYYSFYTINIYVVMCLLERDFCIERKLLNLFSKLSIFFKSQICVK